jgi:hypothetical protein
MSTASWSFTAKPALQELHRHYPLGRKLASDKALAFPGQFGLI